MADEEMEDDVDRERKSLITFKEESLIERQSKVESLSEKNDVEIEDEKYLTVDENEERINGENDKKEIESPSLKEPGEASVKINDVEKESELIEDKDEFEKVEKEEEEKEEEEKEKEKEEGEGEEESKEEEEEEEEEKDKEEDKEEKKKKKPMQQVQKGIRQAANREYRNIIGKRESKKEELEKREGDLRQRLDVLECSMPAVMVWNVWQRMSQGAPVPNLHRLMEKQFRTPAAGEVCCPSTPSRHYDCRVREIEAERKAAQRRLDEARVLWLEKEVKLKERRDKLEDAKRIQRERKEKIERLTNEAKELREALKKMNEEADEGMAGFCESGECGDIQCRERWLRGVNSVDSIKASDVECLARLRQLAENELTMKKQIAELERREETYMRTLQHADEMWSKMEGDTADTLSALQAQLDTKTETNQQLASRICELEDELEKLRTRMALCKSELTKYVSVERIETITGSEDDFAKTTDKMVGIKPKIADKAIEKEYDVLDKEILMKVDVEDKEVSIDAEKPTEVTKPEDEETVIDGEKPTEIMEPDDEGKIIDPEKPTKPIEPEKMDAIHKYLSMLGSLDELYYDDDYGVCSPEYECYEDWQEPETDEEQPLTVRADFGPIISEKIVPTDDMKDKLEELKQIDDKDEIIEQPAKVEKIEQPTDVEKKVKEAEYEASIDKDSANVPLVKLRSWFYAVDSIRSVISKCPTCSVVKLDIDTLIEDIGKYAEVDATEVTPDVTLKLTIEAKADKEEPIEDELKKEVLPEIKEKPIPPEYTIDKIEMKPEKEILPDLIKEPIEEVKEEIPAMVDERSKIEKLVIKEIIPELLKKEDEVELIVEHPTLVPDKVDVILERPKEKITEDADVPIKESEITDDKLAVPTKVEKIEIDIPLDDGIKEKKDLEDETKIILPVPKLIDEKEKEKKDASKDEILKRKEDIELTDDIDKDITEGVVELEEKTEEIELEQVVPPVREGLDVEDKIIEELEDEVTEGESKTDVVTVKVEELKPEVIPEPEIEEGEEIIEPLLKIKSEEKELPLIKDIQEALKYDEIPIEEEDVEGIEVTDEIPVEYKPEDMEEIKEIEVEEEIAKVEPEEVVKVEPEEVVKVEPEEVAKVEPEEIVKEIKIEPIEEIKIIEEVEPIEEVEEIPVKLIEEVIEPSLISVIKEEEEEEEEEEIKEKPKIPIDPRIVPTPYLAVADIEEIKKEPLVDVVIKKEIKPSVCKRPEKITRPTVLPPMQIIINKTEVVQTVIHRGTQTRVVQPAKIKTTDHKSGDTEISSRKMRWQRRPRNKSAIPCSHVSSQTLTTHESISSEKQRLFINILKSLKLDLSTEEKEIRSINYSQRKVNATDKCNCCVCGKDNISFRGFDKHCNRTILKDLKTDVPKMDQNTQDERTLKNKTLKSNITGIQRICNLCASPKVSKAIKKICDQEMCTCSTSIGKSKKNVYKSEKKDQSCLAKISAKSSKIRNKCFQKKDEERIDETACRDKLMKCDAVKHEDTKDQKDIGNSSNCICTKVEKSQSGRLLKQEICGCEEL